MLIASIAFITGALVFYTVGVWSEKRAGALKRWHLGLFWLGFACDTTGTTLMGMLSGSGFGLGFHGITGILAILLMLFHAAWGTVVLAKKDAVAQRGFHRLSIFVWAIWLIPYLSGMIVGMGFAG
jgi:uncharacterized repeat protein (TIGR03987 family)